MTITEYFAVVGSGLSDRDAAVIGPEIERLERLGLSTARGVRDAAREKDSPLHRYVYDCKRSAAADRYYLSRASHILRSVQVEVHVVRGQNQEPIAHRMRAWYPVHAEAEHDDEAEEAPRERQYVSIQRVLASPDLATQVWRDGLRRLQLFRAQFRDYDDIFGPVFRAIEETEKRLEDKAA